MNISDEAVVTLHYKLQVDDADGELIEETSADDPLQFIYGTGQMIPEFERQLAGKSVGDKFAFGIKSGDAYGEYREDAVIDIPITTFMVKGELAEDLLVKGKTISMRDQDGNPLYGTVAEIKGEEVLMDFNHPMAGVDLFFTGHIAEIRPATQSELEHGHVHGPGGHEH